MRAFTRVNEYDGMTKISTKKSRIN